MAVDSVSVKLPPFWPADTSLWFRQVESQFRVKGITVQQTKFDYVVMTLSPEIAYLVRDLIADPPDDNPYDELKKQLVKRTTTSTRQRVHQLLDAEGLGDRKPTDVLRTMIQLMGEDVKSPKTPIFREIFLRRLPESVRGTLTAKKDGDSLKELAELADELVEGTSRQVSTVEADVSEVAEVAQLRKGLVRSKIQKRSQSRERPSRRASADKSQSSDVCWYHEQFGDAACKCRVPCSQSGNFKASR